MINVTSEFKIESIKKRNYFVTADCVLSDGTKLKLKKGDFYNSGNGIVDSSDSSDFPIGIAIEKTATLTLVNDDDRFSGYNFNAARFTLYLTLNLSERSETIKRGTFIVSKKPATAEKISLTLLDHMCLADREYDTNLIFPCTARELLMDSCQTCGIALGDAEFTNSDYQITQKPENTTHRAVIGAVAALAGGNARIDENDYLRIITFDKEFITESLIYDGGDLKNYNQSDILDGGSMDPWSEEDAVDEGTFEEQKNYHTLLYIKNLKYDTDDVIVTGVKYTEDEQEYMVGADGYVVSLENVLLKGNIEDGLNRIAEQIIGMQMRPFSCNSIANAYATFGDSVEFVDVKGRIYRSYLTNVDFLFNGYTTFSCTTKSAMEIKTEYQNQNQATIDQAKKEAEKKLSAYDMAVQHMNQLAANTLGFHYTQEKQEDGSIISYRHDKPTLEDSKIIYKSGIDGFFLSVDGGETWKAGFDSNGDAVLNILYAIGIQSEWINTRGFTAKDNNGDATLRVDADTGRVDIVANSFQLKGKTIEEIAKESAKSYVDSVIIDGIDVSTQYFYAYDPTLENAPASEWTDADTKDKHLNDIFYNTSTKKMFRFVKIDDNYGWENFDDPDIKAALDAASTAQDTADGKRRVFLVTPKPPYDEGDMWVTSTTDGKGEIKICKTPRQSGAFSSADWISPSYVDSDDVDNAINEYDTSLGQPEIFNKLTNNGKNKGIYIQDGELYINASYILSGVLTGKLINGKGLNVTDKNNQVTLKIDDDGNVYIKATEFSLEGKSIDEVITEKSDKFRTLNVIMSNEYQGIPTDMDGNYTSFPSCSTTVKVLYGDEDVTKSSIIQWTASSGIYGSASGETYTVTALSTDTGIITVSVSYNNLSVEKQFTISKQKQGIQGLQGIQGINGKDGISGKDGQDGKTSYFHIKYSSVANPTSSSQMSETPSTYIGTYVDYTEADSDDPGKYTWSRFEGKDGAQGIPGTNGDNGQTSYLHIAYATSSDGKTGFSVSDSAGKTYIGQYTDFKENDSTNPSDYSWTKIKGDTGNGVSVIVQHYLASSSSSGVTTSASGWTESVQAPTSSKRYLWNYQTTTYTDGTSVNTTPHVIGVYGEKGDDGKDASDMTQLEIFNKLTNNGQTQGIYLYNQELYINADYIDTGSLAGWTIDAENKIIKSDGQIYGGAVQLDGKNGYIFASSRDSYYIPMLEGTIYGTSIKGGTIETGVLYTATVKSNNVLTGTVSADSVTVTGTINADGIIKSNSHIEARNNGHFYSEGTGTDLADATIRGDLTVAGISHLNKSVQMKNIGAGSGTDLVLTSLSMTGGGFVFKKASSSKRYKKHLSFMEESDVKNLYDLRPVFFEYKEGYLMESDPDNKRKIPGFYAELVEKYFPDAVKYNEKGQVEDWDPKKLLPAVLKLVQEQKKEIDALKEEMIEIKAALKKGVCKNA